MPQTFSAPWLIPEEQEEVIHMLLKYGIIRYSNQRNLPLKKGGFTDVYINLRDARSHPVLIKYISDLYANALRRLRVDAFVEVPDAVSCIAGPIAVETGIPIITIRQQEKKGRVSDAKTIGTVRYGDQVVILDDVITDGASKIVPAQICQRNGLDVRALLVLVDRQQGWPEHLHQAGIQLPVWPAMTLHDVRRYLIDTKGIMERCNESLEEANPIIVALDGKDWETVLPIADELRTSGCILKVNDLLLNKGAEWILPNLQVYGRIMADFKGHDIPNTLKNMSRHFLKHPPWAVTIQASGGEAMIRQVVETFEGTPTKVLAVTVLTSIDEATCSEVYHRKPLSEVKTLAAIANRAGAHGFVCSPQEVGTLSKLYPGKTFVTPGVRSPGAKLDDQSRVDTPRGSMDNGATNLVMGRQVLGAQDPVAEVHRVLKDELEILF